jgi:hypothetical protein
MLRLSEDLRHVQNPALGALLQWRFAAGYAEARNDAAGSPLVLAFVILPILFHQETFDFLAATNRPSGLRVFASKFASSTNRKSDLLLALHERTDAMRDLSLRSLRMGLAFRLVSVEPMRGWLLPLSRTEPRAQIPTTVRPMVTNAEKLGAWFSQLTPFEVASTLKVRF